MEEKIYRLSADTLIRFGRTIGHVIIEQRGVRIKLTATEWDALVDRSPYMRALAERYPHRV